MRKRVVASNEALRHVDGGIRIILHLNIMIICQSRFYLGLQGNFRVLDGPKQGDPIQKEVADVAFLSLLAWLIIG